ncbi:hypothetical protein L0Z65_11725 [Phaeobacter sp. BS52]|uniref:hypothetical protein n=1 Tax=Rhodobacterales TaxID=204455 RepID=UPI00059098C2|nr:MULTISPECIES: hypothetical protein [Rhodobacterales]AUR34569.1 hypothetical protein PhaeoP18_00270 [Phaeobacter piscinae]MBU3034620.1 hypothetical protein [Tritonibacter mobilis]UTS79256.1 hypothetical protein OL67_000302 [Phaeobacter piscinae]WHQ84641.1 hypothetical protein OMR53_15435 [Tritonibacter mobilis]
MQLQSGKPILLWLIIIGYAIFAISGLSRTADILSMPMPEKRYPALLSNEIAYVFSLAGFFGSVVASAGVAISSFLRSRRAVAFTALFLASQLLVFLSVLEATAFGRTLPNFMFWTFFGYWGVVISVSTCAIVYLLKQKQGNLLQ